MFFNKKKKKYNKEEIKENKEEKKKEKEEKKQEEKEEEEKINVLSKAVEHLNKILHEGNFVELSYLIGNKKQMIIRNFLAGISRGIGIRNRCNNNNRNSCFATSKNSNTKYSNNRRIYSRYSRDSTEK